MRDTILEVCDLTFRFFKDSQRNVLEDVNLTFHEGEVAIVLGNSGCGKSTLASLLCGLYPENGGFLESGTITSKGTDFMTMNHRERCRYIAMMFQNPDLQFCMKTLRREMYFCLENILVPREEMPERVARAAGKYGVADILDQDIATLSGGQKQRAALSCLLLLNPKILLLGEPFANLDDASVVACIKLLQEILRDGTTTVIAIDHRADRWLGIADRIMILGEKGQMVTESMKVEEIKGRRRLFEEQGLLFPYEDVVKKDRSMHAEAAETVISIRQASIWHKKRNEAVLKQVSLEAGKGEIIACLGPSGSGKTSLFLALLGEKKYSGSIRIYGRELSGIKRRDLFRQIGMVFQNPANQFVSTEVEKEITAGLPVRTGLNRESVTEKAIELLDEYHLRQFRHFSPFMLSQGQQRRLGVLTMLSGGQNILLLDEPTYGQDGRTTGAIMEDMVRLVKKGITVIFSTHDRRLADRYADRIWWVEGGRAYVED